MDKPLPFSRIGATRGVSQRVADQVVDPATLFIAAPSEPGVTVSGNVAKGLKYLISGLVASRETAFLTEGDFVRAACTWFYNEVSPKLGGRFAAERAQFNEYVVAEQRRAALLDFEKFSNGAQDTMLKLWAIDGHDEAADHYEGTLRRAEGISDAFGKFTRAWARTNPRLKAIREYVQKRKAKEDAE